MDFDDRRRTKRAMVMDWHINFKGKRIFIHDIFNFQRPFSTKWLSILVYLRTLTSPSELYVSSMFTLIVLLREPFIVLARDMSSL